MIYIEKIKRNKILIILSLCFFILGGAYTIEYFFNFPPCKLCEYQRLNYLLVIAFGLVFFILKKKLYFLYFSLVLFFINFGISIFHSLVERGYVEYNSACSSSTGEFETIDELRNFLDSVDIIKCDEILFSVAGFSLANINVILLLLLIFINYNFIKNEKN